MTLTRVTNRMERQARAAPARLRVLAGAQAGQEIALPAVGVVVGADAGCDVVLTDAAVSGRHAKVVPGEHGFDVEDLGSRNGTFVDGVALTRATVPLGAALRLGAAVIELLPAEQWIDIPPSAASSFGELIGSSLAMRRVFAVLERASLAPASILLGGDSGTGKELAARAVHASSPRAAGPFVVFDCGAASDTLIESALFGHQRGAFTGAHEARAGAFAAAHGGTLFLDEIGDLPLPLQAKLLRMLETGEVTPLGAVRGERHDVRVVAATHRDLGEEVARGAFRGDLYYRLAVVEVELPPLAARREDVAALAQLFLARAGAPGVRVAPGPNLSRLEGYQWPGNVRELRNVMARAVALAPPGADFDALPILLGGARPPTAPPAAAPAAPAARADRPFGAAKEELVARFEREYLAELMARHGDNLAEAARVAGLERKYLYKLLDKWGIARR